MKAKLVLWYFFCEVVSRVVDVWEVEILFPFKMIITFGRHLREARNVKCADRRHPVPTFIGHWVPALVCITCSSRGRTRLEFGWHLI